MHKKLMGMLATLALILTAFVMTSAVQAGATASEESEPCVPSDAYTETIEHPAVTHEETIHHDAVTETTPAIWEVWSPNNTTGPQDYVPTWPSDDRGTWQAAAENIPPGHEGPDGVYQQGSGNSPFFYRQAEKVTVIEEAYDEVVVIVDQEAYTEVIEHAAVTCDEEKKIVVCKYTGTPPGTLHHIIIVSENSLNNVVDANGNSFAGVFPFSWTDAHGQTQEGSIAIRYATDGEQAHDVSLAECPAEEEPPPPTDACPDIDGDQPVGTDCDETVDVCPDIDGDQPVGTDCNPEVLGEQLEIPAEPGIKDPCGAGNARWVVPADTNKLDWTLTDGELSVEILVADTVFTGTEDTTYSFGRAVETNKKACEVKGDQGNPDNPDNPDNPGNPDNPVVVEVKGEQAGVPTSVDAGLGAASSPIPAGRNPLWLLAVGGGLGLMGSAGLRRRKTANR